MMTSPFETQPIGDSLLQSLLPQAANVEADVARLEFATLEISRVAINIDEQTEPVIEPPRIRPSDSAAQMQHMLQTQQHVQEEIEAAYERGNIEGRESESADCQILIASERKLLVKACAGFKTERESYFSAVEAEVVKLALAIAARVLHRESKLDPMFLRGVVKVALEQVMDESGTILRVPIQDVSAWQIIADEYGVGTLEVTADATLSGGECVLETRVGRVELGIAAQLEEIEKGFFDLLRQRPA